MSQVTAGPEVRKAGGGGGVQNWMERVEIQTHKKVQKSAMYCHTTQHAQFRSKPLSPATLNQRFNNS